jgi:hypothetical protein
VEAAVFGLMGLLIAFTFAGAASRYEMRRSLIVDEANAIGTAYLRLDLLPPEAQPKLREDFQRYVHSRLAAYRQPNFEAALPEIRRSRGLQKELWRQAVAASIEEGASPGAPIIISQALNQMIDITTTRTAALQAHLPVAVFVLLGITVLASSLLAGYSMAVSDARNWLHVLCFAFLVASAVYVILEVEYPRLGFIRISHFDEVLRQTLDQMK